MKIKIAAALLLALGLFVFIARKTSSTVRVERSFNAPVERVWELWTEAEAMKKWWSPKGFTAPIIRSDLRPGGTFHLSMRSPKGEMFWNVGAYKEIVPNQRIVSTMSFSDESGKIVSGRDVPVPGVWPEAIEVIVEFVSVNGRTQVTIQEVGIPLIMKPMAKLGWEQQLDKFESLLP